MPARTLLVALALPAMLFAASPALATQASSAGGEALTIVTRDDSLQRAIQAAYVQPFTAVTQAHVVQQVWEGGIETLRSHVKPPDNTWDLVMVDPEELSTGCSEGLFEKLDWSTIGGKDHYLPQAVSDCGVGALTVDTVLAWDKDKLPVSPTWSDFWDVAKYPGKRGLHKSVRGNLEIALMADGVAPGDVYKTLSSAEGVDRAFRKLDQLKPYIVWWSSEAEAPRILSSGDVLMTSAPSGQITTAAEAAHRNFGLQFAGSLYEMDSWAIVKASPAVRTAQQFLYFTGMPAIQQRLLKKSGYFGLAKGLNDGLPPEIVAMSPNTPANIGAALRLDAGFWHDSMPKLRQRFDSWLGH
jgi:putative spermidine/putrescine transport system substrate-binding protein